VIDRVLPLIGGRLGVEADPTLSCPPALASVGADAQSGIRVKVARPLLLLHLLPTRFREMESSR
jgi:hypothetical protein